MVVYLDRVFALNGLLDYALLVVCGTVTATPLRRRRILPAAALGGLYACLTLTGSLRFLGTAPMQLVAGFLLCVLAFGTGRGLFRRLLVLLLLSAAFSGVVLALTGLFSAPASLVGSRVYYPVSLGTLVLTAGGAFGVMRWALRRLRHQGGDIARVKVRLRGRTADFTALRDTGNTLRDPVSGSPVLVADRSIFLKLLPELKDGDLSRPAELLAEARVLGAGPRLIPYRTVGVSRGMLLALRPEDVEINGEKEAMLVAFSPVPVSDGGGYEALLGGTV